MRDAATQPGDATPEAKAIFLAVLPILDGCEADNVRDGIVNVLARVLHVQAKGENFTLEQALAYADEALDNVKRALTLNWGQQ